MENFELGLLLMVVGMAAVYAVLLLVIGLGKALIALVNKYFPEEVVVARSVGKTTGVSAGEALPGQTAAAIVSAVSVLTEGRGKVTKIEKPGA
ncbi:MAG: OadG family protein [Tannerella sp.]|nr:OadG family protein [Tannerella sp.]